MMWKSLGLGTLLLAAAVPAQAADVIVNDVNWVPGLVNADLHYTPGAPGTTYPLVSGGVGIGQFRLLGTQGGQNVTLFTFCADIFNGVDTGTYSYVPLAAIVPDATRQAQLSKLFALVGPLLSAATGDAAVQISAAAQMAAWEIINERLGNPFSLTDDESDFYLVGTNPDFLSAAALGETYLAYVADPNTHGSVSLRGLTGRQGDRVLQSQILIGAVPEPATWLMMIAGVAMVGGALRRRGSGGRLPARA